MFCSVSNAQLKGKEIILYVIICVRRPSLRTSVGVVNTFTSLSSDMSSYFFP